MGCKHRQCLINQGAHWCELQMPNYPEGCASCECYVEEPIITTYTVTEIEYPQDLYINNKKIDFADFNLDDYNRLIEEKVPMYSQEQMDIMTEFMNEATDTLIGNYPIIDTGNNLTVWYELTEILKKLSQKDKDKIRSIVLGINYKSKDWKI